MLSDFINADWCQPSPIRQETGRDENATVFLPEWWVKAGFSGPFRITAIGYSSRESNEVLRLLALDDLEPEIVIQA